MVALLVKPVQDRLGAAGRHTAMDPDLLYFSSPGALKSLALGYDSLLADLYWVRAIQYYGRREEAARRSMPLHLSKQGIHRKSVICPLKKISLFSKYC